MQSVWRALNHPERIPSVDVWRAFAILSVVLYHYDCLPFGYLGVDLFFVISGLLVSRALLGNYARGRTLDIPSFLLRRGFKIWPSYFFFLAVGTVLATALYRDSHPELLIRPREWSYYLLFFQNYRGTHHFIFDHVWSLCVEEHFYVLLPLGLALWRRLSSGRSPIPLIGWAILAGNAARLLAYALHKDTHAATHNRIDALAWGVLMAWILGSPGFKHSARLRAACISGGLAILGGALIAFENLPRGGFQEVGFHGIVPFALFLLVFGTHGAPSSRAVRAVLQPLRWISYYTYNWYLWHVILLYAVRDRLGTTPLGVAVLVVSGFLLSMLATHLVEENGLKIRDRILTRNQAPKPEAQEIPAVGKAA